ECALAITWPAHAEAADAVRATTSVPLGCARLPGSRAVYEREAQQWKMRYAVERVPLVGIAGRVAALTTSVRHSRSARDAVDWLTSQEAGGLIAAESMACAPQRYSQLDSIAPWIDRRYGDKFGAEYAAAIREENLSRLWLYSPRIPVRDAYLAALDEAVQAAAAGQASPSAALAAAAAKWESITDQLGREQQRRAYLASLGVRP
ncbi:MAG: hypothetical protein KDA41_07105, partial [Planctomycetales bacterium]|nr:hypothetical protein [Planctomycetales bacterium]